MTAITTEHITNKGKGTTRIPNKLAEENMHIILLNGIPGEQKHLQKRKKKTSQFF